MKSILKTLSIMMVLVFVFGAVTCAPFSAEQTDSFSKTVSESLTVEAEPIPAEDILATEHSEDKDDTNLTEEKNEELAAVGDGYYNGFEYRSVDSGIVLIKYQDHDDSVTIPSVINNKPVISVGELCFYNTDILEVIIPASITSIEKEAFYNCDNLTSITLPASVTHIGDAVFSGCSSLNSIIVDENNPVYDSRENCNAIIETDTNMLIVGCQSSFIPDSVTSIGDSAFGGCKGLTSITLPDSVTSIGASAFNRCSALTSVTIPASVTSIGLSAFEFCDSLISIDVDENNPVYDSRENCNAIIETDTNMLIVGCQSSFIPDTVTSIGDYAFYKCDNLKTVFIPDSVTVINKYAFCACWNLVDVKLPDTLISIGERGFSGCYNLMSITLPDTLTYFGDYAFAGCSFDSVTIPASITSVSNAAFYYCEHLTSVTIPDSVRSIEDYAFYDCSSLISVTLPDSIAKLGNQVFSSCINLKYVKLPDSLTEIGSGLFEGCASLTSVTIPNLVGSIGDWAFSGCSSLFSVSIPDSVRSIGYYTFNRCENLSSVTIPASVTSIDSNSFFLCSNLTILCVPDSYAEKYAEKKRIPYDYPYNTEVGYIRVHSEETLSGFTVKVTTDKNSIVRTMNNGLARVYGLPNDAVSTVELINAAGRTIAKKENVQLTDGIADVTFETSALSNCTVKVIDDADEEINDCDVKWYVNGAIDPETTSRELHYLNIGDSVKCAVTLSEDQLMYYCAPEPETITIDEKNNEIVVRLEPIPKVPVRIQAIGSMGDPLNDAIVSIVMSKNGRSYAVENYKTDNDGYVSVHLYETDTDIIVAKRGYGSVKWSGTPDGSNITLSLNSLAKARITPVINRVYRGRSLTASSSDEESLAFSVYNQTTNEEITPVSYVNGIVTVPLGSVIEGDHLSISVTDAGGIFAPATVQTVYTENGSFPLTLTELGVINFEYRSSNRENMALIFNSDGEYVDTVDLSPGCFSKRLPEGRYNVVMIETSPAFYRVPSYSYLLDCGLKKGTDFIFETVKVNKGEVSVLHGRYIPSLIETRFTHLDSERSYLTVTPSVINIGISAVLTVNYALPEQSRNGLIPSYVEVELPDGFIPGSVIKVNGVVTSDFEVNDCIIRIPISEYEGKIAMTVSSSKYTEKANVYATAFFDMNGRSLRGSIGSAVLMMKEDFSVPEITNMESFAVSGCVSPRANVSIYVDNVMQSCVKASQMGNFKAMVHLSKTYTNTFHSVVFEVNNGEESDLYRSSEYIVEYDRTNVYVNSISLSPNGMYGGSVKVYSADGNYKNSYYYYPGKYDTLTFTVDFAGDADYLDKVVLLTPLSNGQTPEIPMTRVGESNTFTGSYTYKGCFPQSFKVTYDSYANSFVDSEYLQDVVANSGEIKQQIDENLDDLETVLSSMTDDEKSELNNTVSSVMEEVGLTALCNEVNKNINSVTFEDGVVKIDGKTPESTAAYRTWTDTNVTEEQLLSEGYTKMKMTDPEDCMYRYFGDGKTVTANLNNGCFVEFIHSSTPEPLLLPTGADIGIDATGNDDTIVNTIDLIQSYLNIMGDSADLIAELSNRLKGKINEIPKLTKLGFALRLVDLVVSAVFAYMSYIEAKEIGKTCKKINKELNESKTAYDNARAVVEQQVNKGCHPDTERLKLISNDYERLYKIDSRLLNYYRDYCATLCTSIMSFVTSLVAALIPDVTVSKIISILAGLEGIAASIYGMVMESSYDSKGEYKKSKDIVKTIRQNYDKLINNAKKTCAGAVLPSDPFSADNSVFVKTKSIADPSGYVFEAVESNRLQGVTVTAYYSESPDGSDAQVWEAEDFDQQNPLTTNAMGQYEWYVPDGYWQVKYEKEGYVTAYSDWLPVPPPQMDVNIGLTATSAPQVEQTAVYNDYVDITFSQYMKAFSVNTSTVMVNCGGKSIPGKLTALNAETSKNGEKLATQFRFVPDNNTVLNGSVTVSVMGACNYADSPMEESYTYTKTAEPRVESISCSDTFKTVCGTPKKLCVMLAPANAAAGKTVTASIDNTAVLSVTQTAVTADENGAAEFELNALLPGSAQITFTVEGTTLTTSASVECSMLTDDDRELGRVFSAIPSGSIVQKGIKLSLSNANPDAEIYYTLDMSCPCNTDNPSRILYNGPIVISENTNLIAYAVLDGYEDSTPILYSYTVSDEPFILGDTDGNGDVESIDTALSLRYLVDIETPYTKAEMLRSDVDGSGELDLIDVTFVQLWLSEIAVPYKIGETID